MQNNGSDLAIGESLDAAPAGVVTIGDCLSASAHLASYPPGFPAPD